MGSFSLSGGVEVMGFISPTDSLDTYAVIDPLYGVDGFRNVNLLSDLNLIPEPRRRAGMVVGVSGGTAYYKLNSSPWNYNFADWSVFNTGSGGGTFTGGTVTGDTVFTQGVTATTFSASTYLGLPLDVYVTGGTYSNGTIIFTNTSGGTFNVVGLSTGTTINLSGGTGISVSGTSPNFIVGNTLPDQVVTISGGTNVDVTGTYPNFNIALTGLSDNNIYTTGFTYSANTFYITDTSGNTFPATIDIMTGLTVNGNLTVTGTTSLQGFSATTISATTIGSSGDCVDDIYVSNIHSCSPLNINPLNEGNVYFGSTSGVTIDLTNNRVGIGTTTPSAKLDVRAQGVLSTDIAFRVRNSGDTGNLFAVRGNSNIVIGDETLVDRDIIYLSNRFIRFQTEGLNVTNWFASAPPVDVLSSHKFGFNNNSLFEFKGDSSLHIGLPGINQFSMALRVNSTQNILEGFRNAFNTNVKELRIRTGEPFTTGGIPYNSGNIVLQTGSGFNGGLNGDIIFQISSGLTEVSRITSTGLGIGTITPRESLDVSGNTIITGNLTVSGITGTTWFSGNSSSDLVRVTQTGSGNAFVVEDNTNPDSSPFVIDVSGNTGIGTTTPSEKLDVSGKTKTTNLQVTSGATSGYVLTSDASGNATWQTPTTFTGGTVNGLTATTISASTISGGTLYGDGSNLTGLSSGLNVGTTQITNGTSGRVLFQSGTTLQQDNNFTFDSTLKRLTLRAGGSTVTDIPFIVRNSADDRNIFAVLGNGDVEVRTNRVSLSQSTRLSIGGSNSDNAPDSSGYVENTIVGFNNTNLGLRSTVIGSSNSSSNSNTPGTILGYGNSIGANGISIGNNNTYTGIVLGASNTGGSIGRGVIIGDSNIVSTPSGNPTAPIFLLGNGVSIPNNSAANNCVFLSAGNNSTAPFNTFKNDNLLIGSLTPWTSNFDNNSRGVFYTRNGTAPTTLAADTFALYSADRGGTAGRASAHFRSEDGTINVLGDRTGINTSTPQARLHVANADTTLTTGLFSGSGQNILTIIGSGSTQPLFTVQGSSGELFSVSDSLVGSLFSVNDISGLPILEVFSDNTTLMGSYLAPSLNTTSRVIATTGTTNVYSIPTSAYTGAFFDYTVSDGTNLRAGNIMSIWSGTSVNITETQTTDFGNTSGLTFNMVVSSGNAILRTSGVTGNWTVKTIVRSI